jgi:hypothetical protein
MKQSLMILKQVFLHINLSLNLCFNIFDRKIIFGRHVLAGLVRLLPVVLLARVVVVEVAIPTGLL